MITAVDVIRTKREREPLTDEQVDWIVAGFIRGTSRTSRWRLWRWRSCSTA